MAEEKIQSDDGRIQDKLLDMPELEENTVTSRTITDLEDQSEYIRKIEAALFISGRFLSMQDLITLTDINPLLIKELIQKLEEKYSSEETAIGILNKDNAWKMDVKPEFVGMINKLATGSAEFTKAEQETLAIIAYKQPVKQSVIINIRGNKAYDHIKGFISLGLVRAKRAGHTLELNLSDDFYEYFHIRNPGVEGNDNIKEEKEESNPEEVDKEELNNSK